MYRYYCVPIGYLIGLIQTSYLVGKAFGKIDIREHGSGNAGTTNTLRVMGFKAGLAVFICDLLKGAIGFTLCSLLFEGTGTFVSQGINGITPGMYGALGVILGHCFPFYLKFKGGKGVASVVGVVLATNPMITLIVYAVGIFAVATSKFMSVGSLAAAAIFPVLIYIFGFGTEATVVGTIIACIIWYLHRGNIKKLLTGTENKVSFKKQV